MSRRTITPLSSRSRGKPLREPLYGLAVFDMGFNVVDPGKWRSLTAGVDQRRDGFIFARYHDFDRSIVAIADPASDPQRLCSSDRKVTVTDLMDFTRHHDALHYAHLRTPSLVGRLTAFSCNGLALSRAQRCDNILSLNASKERFGGEAHEFAVSGTAIDRRA